MGILDEAIKEHLELKRQHGAGESELKKIEDEAFGAAERPGGAEAVPDEVAEAPTQFMGQPDLAQADEGSAEGEADAPAAETQAAEPGEAPTRQRSEIADLQEPPVESSQPADEQEPTEEPGPAEEQEPAQEQQPAIEHEAVAEPEAKAAPEPTGPSTEERQAIADQPTEMYDVEAELGEAEPSGSEPEVHDLSEEDEEFWDEKRLSDELDQALEAPVELEEPKIEAAAESAEVEAEPEADEDEGEAEKERPGPEAGHEDVLEDTPDFLEEAPEDDQLWFEQKPPKDFDFDD